MEGRGLFDPLRSKFSPVTLPRNNQRKGKQEQKTAATPKSDPKPDKDKNSENKKKKSNSAPPKTTRSTRTQPTTPNSSSSKKKNVEPGSVVGSTRLSSHRQRSSFVGSTRISSHDKDLDDLRQHSIHDLISPNKKKEISSRSNDGLRIIQIYKEIASLRQENLSVQPYFLKLKTLWNGLDQCFSGGAIKNVSELTERQKVIQFLVGLNDCYVTICGQILGMRPFPTVEEAYSEIIGEEKRRELVAELQNAAKVIETKWLLRDQNSPSKNGVSNHGIDQEVEA